MSDLKKDKNIRIKTIFRFLFVNWKQKRQKKDGFITSNKRFIMSGIRMKLNYLLGGGARRRPPAGSRWSRWRAAGSQWAQLLERCRGPQKARGRVSSPPPRTDQRDDTEQNGHQHQPRCKELRLRSGVNSFTWMDVLPSFTIFSTYIYATENENLKNAFQSPTTNSSYQHFLRELWSV